MPKISWGNVSSECRNQTNGWGWPMPSYSLPPHEVGNSLKHFPASCPLSFVYSFTFDCRLGLGGLSSVHHHSSQSIPSEPVEDSRCISTSWLEATLAPAMKALFITCVMRDSMVAVRSTRVRRAVPTQMFNLVRLQVLLWG